MARTGTRKADSLEIRARELAFADGIDPDSRIPKEGSERGMPAWCAYRDAVKAERFRAEQESLRASTKIIQDEKYKNHHLKIVGTHESNTIEQMATCLQFGNVVGGVLCADGHLGYAQPVGGVVAYENQISISGVGYDIACGNCAVKLDITYPQIASRVDIIAGDIARNVSFGVGHKNKQRAQHELFDKDGLWHASGMGFFKKKAEEQLGTVGSGNHYVDLFYDEAGNVWIGVHFGSRGLGHTTASKFLEEAGGKEGVNVAPTILEVNSDIGQRYLTAMELAGMYAYAGREWVVEKVREIIGAKIVDTIHNHHNYCIHGEEFVQTMLGPKYMKDIRVGDMVCTMSDEGLKYTKVINHVSTGINPIVKLKTKNRSIRTTLDHKVLCLELTGESESTDKNLNYEKKQLRKLCWKEAANITLNDFIVCTDNIRLDSIDSVGIGMARFMGAFLGDGWVRKEGRTVGLAMDNQDYLRLCKSLFPDVNWKFNQPGSFGITGHSVALHEYIRRLQLDNKEKDRFVPNKIFTLPFEEKVEFISGFIDADASVQLKGHIEITNCSKELVRGIRELALSCGMSCTTIADYKRETTFGKQKFSRFIIQSHIPLDLWEGKKENLKVKNVSIGVSELRLGGVILPHGFVAQKVQKITKERAAETFDITVDDESHSFICENVVVHNCWKEEHNGKELWVVRKGATPSAPGQRGFVGGSMGDDAVILHGKETERNKELLYSTVHGAGRICGRAEAKRRFTRRQMDEWIRQRGVTLIGADLDESPMSYRRLPDVLKEHEGTIEIEHTLRPFLVMMAGARDSDPYKD